MEERKSSQANLLVPRKKESEWPNPLHQKYEHQAPLFTASFNGWEEPARMIRVKQFSHLIDRRKPEFFQMLKKRGLIHKDASKYQELSDREKKVYQEHK